MAGPMTTEVAVQAQTIGNGALMLPTPKSNARKKGTPQFLPPEEERSDAPLLLNPMSRSPRTPALMVLAPLQGWQGKEASIYNHISLNSTPLSYISCSDRLYINMKMFS